MEFLILIILAPPLALAALAGAHFLMRGGWKARIAGFLGGITAGIPCALAVHFLMRNAWPFSSIYWLLGYIVLLLGVVVLCIAGANRIAEDYFPAAEKPARPPMPEKRKKLLAALIVLAAFLIFVFPFTPAGRMLKYETGRVFH